MNAGIYSIEHLASRRKYIGSAVNFVARWRVHLTLLRAGRHHSKRLQAAWNKYGEAAFTFRPLFICAKADLIFYEQACIDGYGSYRHGFNAAPTAGSQLGLRHSREARAKIRVRRAAQVFSAETRAKFSASSRGRKMPAWFPEFVRTMRTGSKHTDAAKAKISKAHRGVPETAASKEARATKLSWAKAAEIRRLCGDGRTQTEVAALYRIDQSMVSGIVSGKRWATANPGQALPATAS